jgi:four helix bundle suffix protein
MRERLSQDHAGELPPAPAGKVRLTGLAGLAEFVAKAAPELAANAMICATHQAVYLLNRQLKRQGEAFLQEGGFTENLYRQRQLVREQGQTTPDCPVCGQPMRRRTARQGPRAGKPFWGCSAYPECTGTRPAEPANSSDKAGQSDPSDPSDRGSREKP